MDSVNGRRYNQQGRIANGISSGQLTPHETKNVEGREANLNGEIHNDRAANGGTLTPQERGQVNRQQNNLSHSIYDDKHNGATDQYGNNEVGARRDRQQQRIANGVRSGQMSPSEAAKTENHEQNINHQIAADRSANGGKLTPQEKQNINKKQNGASKQIHEDKHNGPRPRPVRMRGDGFKLPVARPDPAGRAAFHPRRCFVDFGVHLIVHFDYILNVWRHRP